MYFNSSLLNILVLKCAKKKKYKFAFEENKNKMVHRTF